MVHNILIWDILYCLNTIRLNRLTKNRFFKQTFNFLIVKLNYIQYTSYKICELEKNGYENKDFNFFIYIYGLSLQTSGLLYIF